MKTAGFILLVSTALFMSACGSEQTSETDALINAKARRWADPQSIPICFVNRYDVQTSLYDDLLRSAVTQFARAGIGFQKWRVCEPADYNRDIIRVRLKTVYDWDADRYTAGGGKSRVGVSRTGLSGEGGATLWIKVGRDGEYPQGPAGKKNWIANYTRGTFIHEIGHALGLMHEHQRTDFHPKGGECDSALKQPNINESSGEFEYVGSADYESIMSYCSQGTGRLSDGDIAGIRAMYRD